MHVGADYLVNRSLLIGLAVQGDWTDLEENGGPETDGFGFLIGPYATASLTDNLYLDARVGWGRSFNDVKPFGTFTDDVDADRWLITAALIGEYVLKDLNIQPEARLSYFYEATESYVNAINVPIPSVEVETGSFQFGPTISKDFELDNNFKLSPFLTSEIIWNFEQSNTVTSFVSETDLADEGIRGRVEAGLNIADETGGNAFLSANYDGIGDNNFQSWGIRIGLRKKF